MFQAHIFYLSNLHPHAYSWAVKAPGRGRKSKGVVMKLEIRRQGVEVSDEVQAHIERRLLFALGRFSPRIQRVAVYLADLNGPKGGVDKRCRLVARLLRSGVVTVEDRGAELTALIDRASDRLARTVQRKLERRRTTGGSRNAEPDLAKGG